MTDHIAVVARAIAADDGLDPDELRPDGQPNWKPYCPNAKAAIAALEAEGLVIVPVEPSEAMVEAGCTAQNAIAPFGGGVDPKFPKASYQAMLAALEGKE